MIESYAEVPYDFGTCPPRDPAPGEIWIISDADAVVAVEFLCPCGCGRSCYTPVTDATKGQPKTERHWLFSRGPAGVTLSPSIRYLSGCKAHFNIEDGKTKMHADSGK